MRNFKFLLTLLLVVFTISTVVIISCGKKDEDKTPTGPSAVTVTTESASASGSVLASSMSGAGNIGQMQQTLGRVGGMVGINLSKPMSKQLANTRLPERGSQGLAKALVPFAKSLERSYRAKVSETVQCAAGGSFSFTPDQNNPYNVSATFTNCKDTDQYGSYHTLINGSFVINGTDSNGDGEPETVTISATNFEITDYSDNFVTVIAYTKMNGNFSMSLPDTNHATISINGTIESKSPRDNVDIKMVASNFSISAAVNKANNESSVTVNGSIAFTDNYDSKNNYNAGYENFTVVAKQIQNVAQVTINGKVTSTDCFVGWVEFKTLTPISGSEGSKCPTAGVIEVTANGTATITFNSNGSVTIKAGSQTKDLPSCNDMSCQS